MITEVKILFAIAGLFLLATIGIKIVGLLF
jgi:hypothetical protein